MRSACLLLATVLVGGLGPAATAATPDRSDGSAPAVAAAAAKPLEGTVVVLDAGHQLGNHRFPRKINRPVPAGGFKKACNTTGTATDGGYAEASLVWRVTQLLQARLEKQGARVLLTRHSNRQDRWGPCIDLRGRKGNEVDADLKLSIHADGSHVAGARGFHVLAPSKRRPWTHDIFRASRRLARDSRAALKSVGLPVADYTAGGDGIDFRSDLGTLNLSDVPTVMIELGNMRHRGDASRMTSSRGRTTYARGLIRAVQAFVDRPGRTTEPD